MRTIKFSRAQRVERYNISTNPFTGGYERYYNPMISVRGMIMSEDTNIIYAM